MVLKAYRGTWLTRLKTAVKEEHPPESFDSSISHVIADWVAREQPASRLAKPRAEEHIRGYLDAAFRVGRKRGWACYWTFWFPLSVVIIAIAIAILIAKM